MKMEPNRAQREGKRGRTTMGFSGRESDPEDMVMVAPKSMHQGVVD